MKSKYKQTKPTTAEKQKVENNYDILDIVKPFDFVRLYKTAEETNKILAKYKTDDSTLNKDNTKNKLKGPKRERSLRKNNIKNRQQEPLGISQINIDASSLNSDTGACVRAVGTQSNSAPKANSQGARIKSIMKSASASDEAPDAARSPVASSKPKKRNKSVSFMLDDTEEVVIKRTKSSDEINVIEKKENTKLQVKDKRKAIKRLYKKDKQENTEVVQPNMDVDTSPPNVPEAPVASGSQTKKPVIGSSSSTPVSPSNEKKKKLKKTRKPKPEDKMESNETKTETSNSNDVTPEIKHIKKLKKKKQVKPSTSTKKESGDGDDEPVMKARKTELRPDLAEDLGNLSIGDNAHTLSNMLDEMSVVDRDKHKKAKQKLKKNRKQKNSVKEESENTEEVKEKVKWKKRKWNKDKKGEISDSNIDTTVIVENLPFNIVLNYKKLLTDYFVRHGLVKKVG